MVRFKTEIEQKPLYYRQFSQNVTFFMLGISSKGKILLINWKRTKGEILDRNWAKTPYNTATIFTKCNAHRQKVRIFTHEFKWTKGEISDRNWAKTQYNTASIFTKFNVFLC